MRHTHPYLTSRDLRHMMALEIIRERHHYVEARKQAWCMEMKVFSHQRYIGALIGLSRAFMAVQTARTANARKRLNQELKRGQRHEFHERSLSEAL